MSYEIDNRSMVIMCSDGFFRQKFCSIDHPTYFANEFADANDLVMKKFMNMQEAEEDGWTRDPAGDWFCPDHANLARNNGHC